MPAKVPTKKNSTASPKCDLLSREQLPLLALASLLIAALFWPYLCGEQLYVFRDAAGDSLNSYFPSYLYFADAFAELKRSAQWSWWSFQMGIGANVFSRSIELLDIFNWPLFFLDKPQIASAIIWLVALKVLIAALLCHAYLRIMKCSSFGSTIGALLYSFSAYMILWGQHYQFGSAMVFGILLLYAFERQLQRGLWGEWH